MAGLWLLGCACRGPSLAVDTEPEDATLLADGRVVSKEEPIPFRYYGGMHLRAQPAAREKERFEQVGVERTVTISEPVTPWVFPLDFVAEVFLQPFGGAADREVTLQLPDNPDRVRQGLEPEAAGEVLARSRSARVDR